MHSLSQDTRASGHQIYFVIKGFAPFKPKADIFTARKRSLGQGNVFTRMCHSVHGGRGSLYDATSCLAVWSHVLSGGSVSRVFCTHSYPVLPIIPACAFFTALYLHSCPYLIISSLYILCPILIKLHIS